LFDPSTSEAFDGLVLFLLYFLFWVLFSVLKIEPN
jgi:hypothetical protein